jgi:DNA sulfur modification protein DndB
MPVSELTERVSFADQIHTANRYSNWIQRQLQEGRSKDIAEYLRREKERFFNSLVVAVYGGDPVWHALSHLRPGSNDIDIADIPEEVEATLGLLSFTGSEKMFAIDGQHRLAGLRRALSENEKLGAEELPIILVAHRNSVPGMERTRRLFTTLNKTAKPVGKGEIIALDEDDVMAIVVRHLVETDSRFMGDRIKLVQAENISADDTELTTIGNLYDVLTVLFRGYRPTNIAAPSLSELKYSRPPDPELERYKRMASDYFDGLGGAFSALGRYFKASDAIARKIVSQQRTGGGGHVLFRPAGLRLFTEVFCELVSRCGLKSAEAFEKVKTLPFTLSDSPFNGVLWKSDTKKMNPSGRPLCRRLLLHMLGFEPRPKQLQATYAKFLGMQGEEVKLPFL